jgi:hypothetical protein
LHCSSSGKFSAVSTLKLIPKSWLSWDFNVLQDDHLVAEIDISQWREKGKLAIDGSHYDVYREGLLSGAFLLEGDGTRLAGAIKPSVFARSFEVEYIGKTYQWRGELFKRKFILSEGEQEVGSLTPDGIFTRRATAEFPDDLVLPVKVFLIWLALILWKRDAESSA